jgi:hypothetical protein
MALFLTYWGQVLCGGLQQLQAVLQKTDAPVATTAQQAANVSGVVIDVNPFTPML